MLARRGLPALDAAKYRDIFDFPVRKCYERAGFDFSKETFDFAASEFCDAYARRVGECRLHDGGRGLECNYRSADIGKTILRILSVTFLFR